MKTNRTLITNNFGGFVCVLAYALLATALVIVAAPATAHAAGWRQADDGTYYYQNADGSYVVNDWINYEGEWYFFGSEGKLVTDSFVTKTTKSMFDFEGEKESYYVGPDGRPCTDYLLERDGYYYYFGSDGKMVKNDSITYEGKTYVFDQEGKCMSASEAMRIQAVQALVTLFKAAVIVGIIALLINPKTRPATIAVLKVIFFMVTIIIMIGEFVSPRRRD